MRKQRNIYKSVLDAIIYFALYLCVPLTQCIAYLIVGPSLFWFSAFLAVSSLLYDCYTRYNKNCSRGMRDKILCIGFVSFFLLLYTISVFILRASEVPIDDRIRLPYLLLVVPFFISLRDGLDIFFRTINKEVL